MKRFADSLVRQKGIQPPPGYKTSISICRKFLSEHAPKKADGETAGKLEPKSVSQAQLMYAKKIAQGMLSRIHLRVARVSAVYRPCL
jgi:DNA topoisomerase-3